MATLTCRAFSNSATYGLLSRSVQNFENNCLRIVGRLHKRGLTQAPAPSICDAIATLADGDDVLAAQLFGGALNPDIETEIADTVASSFDREKGKMDPTTAQIQKVVGRKLGAHAYKFLSFVDRLAIVRTLDPQAARTLCEKRLQERAVSLRDSVATL